MIMPCPGANRVLNRVLRVGHSIRAQMGHSWRAPKPRSRACCRATTESSSKGRFRGGATPRGRPAICTRTRFASSTTPSGRSPCETRFGGTWGGAGAGVHFVGDGAMQRPQAVAQQEDAQDVPEAGRWQMPALLRVIHRRGFGAVLRAHADLVSVPAAGLL